MPTEKPEKVQSKENSPKADIEQKPVQVAKKNNPEKHASPIIVTSPNVIKNSPPLPPDVTSMKSFPAMPHDPKTSPNVSSTESQDATSPDNTYNNKSNIAAPETPLKANMDISFDTYSKTSSIASDSSSDCKSPPSDVHTPKTVQDSKSACNNPLPPPPDVHNIKNFPAMPNPHNSKISTTDKVNSKNVCTGKIRNVSPSAKTTQESASNNNNTISNNNVQGTNQNTPVVQNDIQNDLSVSIFIFF